MQACDRCHARKTRCDRRFPQCGACEKAGVSCVHADKLRQRNIPRGYLDSMEATVRQLQEENRALRQGMAQAQAEAQARAQMAQSPAGQTAFDFDDLRGPDPNDHVIHHHDTDHHHNNNHDHGHLHDHPHPPISPPSSTCSPPDNAFAVEVGYLSLIATGETRYLGTSSGLGLANMISTMVTTQGMDEPGCPSVAPSASSTSTSSTSSTIIPSASSATLPSTLPSTLSPSSPPLPPLATVRPYIQAYFQHTHITFPLLHRPSFLAAVERIYGEPGYYERHPREAFVLDMVLAIGSANFNRFDESAAARSCGFFAAAQAKLPAMLSMDDSLTALQAILLISQHGIFSNLRDTSASIWHLVGVGARICIEQGLHLERRQLQLAAGGHARPPPLSLDEELRRRCFWSLYNLDRVVSFTLGRPVAIRDDEIDVPLPSPLDDDCFAPGTDGDAQHARPGQPGSPSVPDSPFLHLIRIRRLSGQILSQFYNTRHQQCPLALDERRRIRRRFHADIDAWRDATHHLPGLASPPPAQASSSSSSSSSSSTSTAGSSAASASAPPYKSSFLTLDWYDAVYNNAILLLYRPSPFLPHPAVTRAPGDDGQPELLELLHAARASIESYSRLHQKRRLNYSWITLHGVFIAGLSYIYALGRLLRDPATFALVPELFSIVEVTRSCSNVLVAICERWNASRRSCDLFNKLSNAVIRDALNASARQAARLAEPLAPVPYGPGPGPGPAIDPVLDGHMQLDDNFVMDEFRQFMDSLDAGLPGEATVPSELVAGFLQDWPFDIPVVSPETDSGAHLLPWELNVGG